MSGPTVASGSQHVPTDLPPNLTLAFELLPEVVDAAACAQSSDWIAVNHRGVPADLTIGERAAVVEAYKKLNGDLLYLTRSVAWRQADGQRCGRIWGRVLKARQTKAAP